MKSNKGFIAMELVISAIVLLSAVSIYKIATNPSTRQQTVSQAVNPNPTTPLLPTETPMGFDEDMYQSDFDTAVSYLQNSPELMHVQEVISRNGHELSYDPEGEEGNLFTVSVYDTVPNGDQKHLVGSFEVDIVTGEVSPFDLPRAERIPLEQWQNSVNNRYK